MQLRTYFTRISLKYIVYTQIIIKTQFLWYVTTESAFQVDLESADIPKIPIQPIGYDDAKVFLR